MSQKHLNYKIKALSYNNKKKLGGNKKLKNKPTDYVPKYTEHLSEPWFSLISLKLKTVEGRKNKGRFKEMNIGDIIQWTNDDFMPRFIITKITKKTEYKTFEEYLIKEGLHNCLPGITDINIGLSVYYKYFSKEEELEFGVVAIKMKVLYKN